MFLAGLESVAVYKTKLCTADEKSWAVSQTMEAFVCYQLLYKKWWSHCSAASTLTNNMMSNGHPSIEKKHPEDANCNGKAQSEDFWKVLLSEPHASFQAIQRAIAEIQSKVLSLVQQHNPSTDAHLSSDTATETPERLEEHEGTSGEKRYGDQILLEWKSVFLGISVKMTLFVFYIVNLLLF